MRMGAAAIVLGITAAVTVGGCNDDGGSKPVATDSRAATTRSATECGTYSGRGCAPSSERVDLGRPSFSNSTRITNRFFPISRLRSVVLLGHVDGKPFRTETTLLPGTGRVSWNGRRIPVLRSQYLAYLDGQIEEVALDRYAQADDGSVWYLGEDVFDYRNGAVALTEGTWLAGREGPAAMIMPARPRVGQVFRPENIPGIVWEEVRVGSVSKTVEGPLGPIKGAMVGQELHTDGTREDKFFAPGYGEFRTAGGGDVEALALAVPKDAARGREPAELGSLRTSAAGILESARLRDWEAASATIKRMNAAWAAIRARKQPRLVAASLSRALATLTRAVKAHGSGRTAQAAVDVGQLVLDLQLRYRPAADIDAARFELRTQQLRVHAAAKDQAGVTGDVATLEWIRDRFAHALPPSARGDLDARLRALRSATDAENLAAAADHAARLGARLRNLG